MTGVTYLSAARSKKLNMHNHGIFYFQEYELGANDLGLSLLPNQLGLGTPLAFERSTLKLCLFLELATIFTGIVTLSAFGADSLGALQDWLLVLIVLEALKMVSQVLLFRAFLRESQQFVIDVLRYVCFFIDNVWFIWEISGNMFYYSSSSATLKSEFGK